MTQDLHRLGVREGDLLHMDNTVQMHKPVPQPRAWRSVVFTHQAWRQRLYWLPTAETGELPCPVDGSDSSPPPQQEHPSLALQSCKRAVPHTNQSQA